MKLEETDNAPKMLRAIYVVSPDGDDYVVTEAMVEQVDGEIAMFMLRRGRAIQVEPDRNTIEQLLDHRSSGIVNAAAPVLVASAKEAKQQVGKPYSGPTGWDDERGDDGVVR
jgi:hypothetical protein